MGSHQGPPNVTYHDAYRFEIETEGRLIEGTVFKVLPRRVSWEARVDDSPIRSRGETRGEAVAAAIQDRLTEQ